MPSTARMLGKTRPKANCPVPGHGDRCTVAAEVQERSVGRAAEKREWSADADVEMAEAHMAAGYEALLIGEAELAA